MSTALAIASVTAVLKDLLHNGLIDHDLVSSVGDVTVSALPPDRIDITEKGASQLNIFLYQVTPNIGWRNVGMPSRDGNGLRLTNPPLALDLHYLLTAYGVKDLHAEILLGYGMQLLHETPVLTRDAIRTALKPPTIVDGGGDLPAELRSLFESELSEQVEQIKIVPQALSSEEISKLWSAFQARYRPTAAYQASVVLIESRQSTKSSLPVRARKIYAVPFRQPTIEQILSQETALAPVLADQPILPGSRLVIKGKQLLSEDTRVEIGGIEIVPQPNDIEDTKVTVQIPASVQAGIQGLQVVQRILMGSPPVPHQGVSSNVFPFVMRPLINPLSVAFAPGGPLTDPPIKGTVSLNLEPAVGDEQHVVLLLNELIPQTSPPTLRAPYSYSFRAPFGYQLSPPLSPPDLTNSLSIPISGVKAGTYLVRVQVDGAESVLGTDMDGKFNSPTVVIA
ncbi:MAG: DUF4255 domain-containing protein [Pyrinomonadaceae bacterium]